MSSLDSVFYNEYCKLVKDTLITEIVKYYKNKYPENEITVNELYDYLKLPAENNMSIVELNNMANSKPTRVRAIPPDHERCNNYQLKGPNKGQRCKNKIGGNDPNKFACNRCYGPNSEKLRLQKLNEGTLTPQNIPGINQTTLKNVISTFNNRQMTPFENIKGLFVDTKNSFVYKYTSAPNNHACIGIYDKEEHTIRKLSLEEVKTCVDMGITALADDTEHDKEIDEINTTLKNKKPSIVDVNVTNLKSKDGNLSTIITLPQINNLPQAMSTQLPNVNQLPNFSQLPSVNNSGISQLPSVNNSGVGQLPGLSNLSGLPNVNSSPGLPMLNSLPGLNNSQNGLKLESLTKHPYTSAPLNIKVEKYDEPLDDEEGDESAEDENDEY